MIGAGLGVVCFRKRLKGRKAETGLPCKKSLEYRPLIGSGDGQLPDVRLSNELQLNIIELPKADRLGVTQVGLAYPP